MTAYVVTNFINDCYLLVFIRLGLRWLVFCSYWCVTCINKKKPTLFTCANTIFIANFSYLNYAWSVCLECSNQYYLQNGLAHTLQIKTHFDMNHVILYVPSVKRQTTCKQYHVRNIRWRLNACRCKKFGVNIASFKDHFVSCIYGSLGYKEL